MTPTQDDAIRQALEAICGAKLCEINSMSSRREMVRLMDKAITALKAALAEPVQQGWASIPGSNVRVPIRRKENT